MPGSFGTAPRARACASFGRAWAGAAPSRNRSARTAPTARLARSGEPLCPNDWFTYTARMLCTRSLALGHGPGVYSRARVYKSL
jgi:hypothetical protein